MGLHEGLRRRRLRVALTRSGPAGPLFAVPFRMRNIILILSFFSIVPIWGCSSTPQSSDSDASEEVADAPGDSQSMASSVPDSGSDAGSIDAAANQPTASCPELLADPPMWGGYLTCRLDDECSGQLTCWRSTGGPECVPLPPGCSDIACVCETDLCGDRSCLPAGSLLICGDLPGMCAPGVGFELEDGCNTCICPESGVRAEATCCSAITCPVYDPCEDMVCGDLCIPCAPDNRTECGENYFYFCSLAGECEPGPQEGPSCMAE